MDRHLLAGFFDEVEQLEKQALDPITSSALSHVGGNVAMKALHGTKMMTKYRAGRMAEGIRRGISGAPQSFGSKAVESFVRPELAASEHAGANIGSALSGRGRGRQVRALKKLRKAVAMNPALQKAPYYEDVVGGVNRALQSPLPRSGVAHGTPLVNRAMGTAGIVSDPVSAAAAVKNVGATKATFNPFSKDAIYNALPRARTAAYQETMSPAMTEALVSPRALDQARISSAVANTPDLYQARRLSGAIATLNPNEVATSLQHVPRIKPTIPVPAVNPNAIGVPQGVRF